MIDDNTEIFSTEEALRKIWASCEAEKTQALVKKALGLDIRDLANLYSEVNNVNSALEILGSHMDDIILKKA